MTPLVITHPEPAPLPESTPEPVTEPAPTAANGTGPKRSPRSTSEPRPPKPDPRLLATLDQSAEIEAATRLVRARLARASWPLSALMVEARAVGIGEPALKAALQATNAHGQQPSYP